MAKSRLPAARRRNNSTERSVDTDSSPPRALGASDDKDSWYGRSKVFGNAVPQELKRDPYRVNKNAG